MSRLRLSKNISSREIHSGIDAFLFNTNMSNYSKNEMSIINGQVDCLSYKTMDKLLDRAFEIWDWQSQNNRSIIEIIWGWNFNCGLI